MNNSKKHMTVIYSDSHSFLSMLNYFSVEMIALVIFLTSGPISIVISSLLALTGVNKRTYIC